MKKTEAYFKLLSLLLLTACQTAEPPEQDQPASSAATETTDPLTTRPGNRAPRLDAAGTDADAARPQ